ncbi:MAG TPA: MTH1187 family thiamine-binding protein [Lacipirellulaceae bacterium]|nr:MTH1187 family thiamine-binding protein [Lacipirellulaceae bacterium]
MLATCFVWKSNRDWNVSNSTMVLLEMSITPLGKGESVSEYVAKCVDIVDRSGLDYELHAMGTVVEGELDQVLDIMRRCIERVAEHSDRVTCAAKLDYRRGQSGRLKSKVASVEQKLGRSLGKSAS